MYITIRIIVRKSVHEEQDNIIITLMTYSNIFCSFRIIFVYCSATKNLRYLWNFDYDLWKRLIILLFVWLRPLKEANDLVICMIMNSEKGQFPCSLYDYDLWKRLIPLLIVLLWTLKEANSLVNCMNMTSEKG